MTKPTIDLLSLGLPPSAFGRELASTDQLYDAASTVSRELQVAYNAMNRAIWQAHASAAVVAQLSTTQFEDPLVYSWAGEADAMLMDTLKHLRRGLRCFDDSRGLLFGILDHLKPLPEHDPTATVGEDLEGPGGPEGGGAGMADPSS